MGFFPLGKYSDMELLDRMVVLFYNTNDGNRSFVIEENGEEITVSEKIRSNVNIVQDRI